MAASWRARTRRECVFTHHLTLPALLQQSCRDRYMPLTRRPWWPAPDKAPPKRAPPGSAAQAAAWAFLAQRFDAMFAASATANSTAHEDGLGGGDAGDVSLQAWPGAGETDA